MGPALSVVVSLALGATVSSSRLGVVVSGSSTAATAVLAACPRAVKAAQPLASATSGALLASYRAQCTGGDGILELPNVTPTTAGGLADANTYWGLHSVTAFSGVTPTDLRWVAGPANLFLVADPNSPATADYARAFVSQLATLIRARATSDGASYSLLLPPWSSTTPGAFCGVLSAALAADPGIGWTWSGTSAALSSTLANELSTTFGYRAVRDACAATGVPILAELSATGGWFTGGRTSSQVLTFLKFVDATAAADPDVSTRGAILLRSLGTSGAQDDLSPAAADLAAYLANPSSSGGSGGGGTSSGGVNGGGGAVGGGSSGGLAPTSGHQGGCGHPAGGLALLGLAPLGLRALRRRRGR